MKPFFRKLAWLARRRDKESELQEELQFHLEAEAEERIEAGCDAADARLDARRELGNLAHVQEETRAAWGWTLLEQFRQDARYAFRMMAANRLFSALAILSLALGIGANTAIFSFMDAILLRSLPVAHPESLVTLSWRTNEPEVHGMNRHDDSFLGPKTGYGGSIMAYPAFEMMRKNEAIFSSVFGFQGAGALNLVSGNRAEIARAEYVTGNYFQGLGVPPAAGRLIQPDDDRPSESAVAVISYALGQRRFGGAMNAPGQTILLNNTPFRVIGVAPPEFFGADPGSRPDVFVPMHANLLLDSDRYQSSSKAYTDPNYEWVIAMGRLRGGVTREQAQAVLAPQFAEWMKTVNTERTRTDLPRLVVRDGGGGMNGLRMQYSKPLFVLMALVGLILAIACANIANLLLARAEARRREIAVRLGIGAGRGRLIRQLLTESGLLASVGGILGIGLGVVGIRLLTMLLAVGRDDFSLHAELNWRVLLVAAALSMATGVLCGLAPALAATRVDLLTSLKQLRTAGPGWRRLTLRQSLMVAQIALGLVVLVAAGLFARTLSRLESVQLGFNRENVLLFRLDAWQAGHPKGELPAFYEGMRKRFAGIPGVRSASLSDSALLEGRIFTPVSVPGQEAKTVYLWPVGPDFFTTMQIPLVLGRGIQEHDMGPVHTGAVVSQDFVRQNFGGRNPLGQLLKLPDDCPRCEVEVVGVCADVLIGRSVRDEHGPTVFIPYDFGWPLRGMNYELRTAGNPLAYAAAVRESVRQADPRLPVSEIRSQKDLVDGTMNTEIVFARLCSGFAALALVIACVGLYGAMSYNVARRTAEIGIRMALGAPRGRVLRMVLMDVLALTGAGLALGIPAALAGSRLLEQFLFETDPGDPRIAAIAGAALLSAAIAAGYLPARSAARIDPMVALRHE